MDTWVVFVAVKACLCTAVEVLGQEQSTATLMLTTSTATVDEEVTETSQLDPSVSVRLHKLPLS